MKWKNNFLKFSFFFFFIFAFGIAQAAPLIDTFEDGDYSNNPTWTILGNVSMQSDTVKNGSYAIMTSAGPPAIMQTNIVGEAYGDTYQTWVRTTNQGSTNNMFYSAMDAVNNYIWSMKIVSSRFYASGNGGPYGVLFTTIPLPNTWYKYKIVHAKNSPTVDYYLYDASENLLEEKTGVLTGNVNPGSLVYLGAPFNDSSAITYFDDVTYGFTQYTCGNSVCEAGENCDTCRQDCAPCPATLEERVSALEQQGQDLIQQNSTQQASIDSLVAQNSEQQNMINSLSSTVSDLQAGQATMQQSINSLSDSFGLVQTTVYSLQQELTQFKQLILTYLTALDFSTKQKMVCATLSTQNSQGYGLGLKCTWTPKKCTCTPA
ncbi:MAG TPA: hypothetical protein VI977_03715 [archaeon]|nr:hypothetical protein [archaeon]